MALISFLKILFFLFNYTPTNLFLLIRNGQKYPSIWKQNEKWRKKKKKEMGDRLWETRKIIKNKLKFLDERGKLIKI